MSLKAFHVFFVLASMALMLLFGGWAVRELAHGGGMPAATYTAVAAACLGVLLWYGPWMLRKLRGTGYL